MGSEHTYEAHFEVLGSCRDVDEFEKLNRIGEGTYGTVYRARDRKTKEIVALKRVILHNESNEGFPITAIREIKLLKRLQHPNCVRLLDVVVGRKRSSVFLVFEYCEHDLSLLRNAHRNPFKESELKRIIYSILHAVHHLHCQNIIHRDIKLSNILYDRYGQVKLADFGLAREISRPSEPMTPKVVTLWYRAPEILLGDEKYTSAVDLWACGCIFGELLMNEPLIKGRSDMDQLEKIYKLLGRPNDQIWPGMSDLPNADKVCFDTSRFTYNNLRKMLPSLSEKGLDLMNKLLTYDPKKRITAKEAMSHPYFKEKPFPQETTLMPTFPSIHGEMAKHRASIQPEESKGRYLDDRFGKAFEAKRRRM